MASIPGQGTTEKAIKGALTGVAIQQGFETIADVVKPNLPVTTDGATKGQQFVAAMSNGMNGADSDYILPTNAWGDDSEVIQMNSQGGPFSVNNVASV